MGVAKPPGRLLLLRRWQGETPCSQWFDSILTYHLGNVKGKQHGIFLDTILPVWYVAAMEKILRKKQEDVLLQKLSDFIVRKLNYMIDIEGWQGTEIYDKYGLPSNRQSELKKGKRRVSKPSIRKLLGGRFVTLNEIESNVDLSENEKRYLYSEFGPYDNPNLHPKLQRFTSAGVDVIEALEEYEKNHPEKFNKE